MYLCIDLKSFYASVECVARGLDPFTTNLVVADPSRGRTTICLAITPAMKELGIRNRCRVFEIPPEVDYLMARPRMRRYMEVSASIYAIYLRYVSAQDVHVYSVDECFIDATPYLSLYHQTPREFAVTLMDAVFVETGICATAGIGTNLFLAKVALDITAKHVPDHIGFLDKEAFERTIQTHRPITDVWNVGPGIAARLARMGVYDLRGVCAMDEAALYREFGVNAEYLIDHAHGVEPCTIAQIQAYKPRGHSLANSQILPSDYSFADARLVFGEMIDALVLDLVDKGLVAQSISVYVGYGRDCKPWGEGGVGDHDGATRKLPERTDSLRELRPRFEAIFDECVDAGRTVRRLSVGFGTVMPAEFAETNLFTDMAARESERALQKTVLDVKERFGKNALLRAVSLTPKATARERNEQVGGHHE